MEFERKGLAFINNEPHSVELYQAALDAVRDEVVIVSVDCKVLFANAAAAERIGAPDPASMTLTCHEMHYRCHRPDETGIEPCPVKEALKTGSPVTGRHVVLDDFGNLIPMGIEATPIFDQGGAVRWIIQVLTEIHDEDIRPKTDENRRLAENERNLKFMGVLNEMTAHDFNNLMSGILSNVAYLLEMVPVDSSNREILLEIADAASRAGAKISGAYREVSFVSEMGALFASDIDLNALLGKMRPKLEASAPGHVVFRFDLDEDIPLILGNPNHIEQIVTNLVSNAIDAVGASPGVIKLQTGKKYFDAVSISEMFPEDQLQEGLYAFFEISDTGDGMEPETMSRIFTPFFTTKSCALGLGLKTVTGLVRNGRGAVEVFSRLKEGSTFRVLFPAASVDTPACRPDAVSDNGGDVVVEGDAREKSAAPVAAKKILVVDDEEPIRNVAGHMLEFLGYKVECVSNGREALRILEEQDDFALVLLDFSMPNMGGEECFFAIDALDKEVKVVMSSGHFGQDIIGRFRDRTPDGYIQKPYRLDELRTVVSEALRRPLASSE